MKRPSRKIDEATVARAVELKLSGATMRAIADQLRAEGRPASRASLGDAFKRPEIAERLAAAGPVRSAGAPASVDEDLEDGWRAIAEEGLELLRAAFGLLRTKIATGDATEKDIRLLLDGAERSAKVCAALDARTPAQQGGDEGGERPPEVVELDEEFLDRLRELDAARREDPPPPPAGAAA